MQDLVRRELRRGLESVVAIYARFSNHGGFDRARKGGRRTGRYISHMR